ncbi:MAG TPA: response regulator [Bacteroidia bacterium]|jgi:two-component system OmpR family response regulator|nr:response regulator [Bacteroidia bacterium]
MNNEKQVKLFLVDDDALFLKTLELQFLEHEHFIIETYPTGEICIENISRGPDIIILDYFLNGIDNKAMTGLETLDKITDFNPAIPVIMLSSQDKIDVAIDCMHHKAFDYVVKSETAFNRLQKIITTIFRYKKMEKALNWYIDKI